MDSVMIIISKDIPNNNDTLKIIDSIMERLVTKSQFFLFNVYCGGPDSIGWKYAELRGLPHIIVTDRYSADFYVILTSKQNKNNLYAFAHYIKTLGKHGTLQQLGD